MLRQPEAPGDPVGAPSLRDQFKILMAKICQAYESFDDGLLDYQMLERLYRTDYQPQAVALVRAAYEYVPDEEGRRLRPAPGGVQDSGSVELPFLDHPLSQDSARAQLFGVLLLLEQFARHVP